MAAAPQTTPRRAGAQRQRTGQVILSRRRQLQLWYWGLAVPSDGKYLRTVVIHPLLSVALIILGLLAVLLEWLGLSFALPEQLGVVIAASMLVAGVVMLALAIQFSSNYYTEYPGKYTVRLKEYVARRVSRLSKDEFIPQYKTHDYPANEQIQQLNRRVRRALRVETARLAQSDPAEFAPVCGVFVVGPKHGNKTGALWDAMAHELKGWTFIRWPHHMDHPANLARRVGHRVVLWIDNLHDFAHPGEAAALAQFVQQLRENGRQLMVLTSCRDRDRLQETERFLRPLTSELRWVNARMDVNRPLPLTERLQQLTTAYQGLAESQKSILRTIEWLRSMRVFTFPVEVLVALHVFFLNAQAIQENEPSWDAALQALTDPNTRFVRVDQRIDAEARLSEEPYSFRNKLNYNLLHKQPPSHKIVEPINSQYINPNNLEGSRGKHVRRITAALEQAPDTAILQLAGSLPAAETLILIGDAYLNHLGETIENAAELAIKCYVGTLETLDQGGYSDKLPGAWAAAHVGKGTAALRMGRLSEADTDFSLVSDHDKPNDDARPTPPLLMARAWHGRGDVIAAQIPGDIAMWAPSEEAIQRLRIAAEYYEKAINSLERHDPLLAEANLDRANMLYLIAQVAMRDYMHPSDDAPKQAPVNEIHEAQTAFERAQEYYTRDDAPAIWAEMQRRQGELRLMELIWLLPATKRIPFHAAMAVDQDASLADEANALETAKVARDYFIAARDAFAPSFLPMDWAQSQIGLAHALLIIARIVANDDKSQAEPILRLCLATTKSTVQEVASLAQSPLVWVDLQVLRAVAEIERALLDEEDPEVHYNEARLTLENAAKMLNTIEQQLAKKQKPGQIADQWKTLNALRQQILPAPTS